MVDQILKNPRSMQNQFDLNHHPGAHLEMGHPSRPEGLISPYSQYVIARRDNFMPRTVSFIRLSLAVANYDRAYRGPPSPQVSLIPS